MSTSATPGVASEIDDPRRSQPLMSTVERGVRADHRLTAWTRIAGVHPEGVLWHPLRALIATREDLASARADNRMSAYIYGDVLVLAATAGVYDTAIRSGEALLVVLGTVASTYVAHVLADVVGAVFGGHELAAALLDELRDSVPIATAGLPPLILFSGAALGWPSPEWAQAAASVVLVLRLASIGAVYHHLKEPIGWTRATSLGVLVAGVAALAVALKLVLTH